MSWYLIPLLVMVGLCGLAALKDKTPRKPFEWRRPEIEFWAMRRTQREMKRHQVVLDRTR